MTDPHNTPILCETKDNTIQDAKKDQNLNASKGCDVK